MAAESPSVERTTYKGFEFPPFYDFPPFFTRQPAQTTRQTQLQMWGDLILSYYRHFSLHELDLGEAISSPLFRNDKIERRVGEEDIRIYVQSLVEAGKAQWQQTSSSSSSSSSSKVNKIEKTRAWIYWRRPEEWGSLVYQWASNLGKLNEVLTVFDVREGEDSEKEEFFQLPSEVMIMALEALQKGGKAVVFSGETSDAMGVKFFH